MTKIGDLAANASSIPALSYPGRPTAKGFVNGTWMVGTDPTSPTRHNSPRFDWFPVPLAVAWSTVAEMFAPLPTPFPNSGFEDGLRGWTRYGTTSGLVLDTAVFDSGAASGNVSGFTALDGVSNHMRGTLEANTPYTITVRLKGQSGGEQVQLLLHNSDGSLLASGPTTTLTTNWTTVTWVVTPTSTVRNPRLQAVIPSSVLTNFWVDSLAITPTPAEGETLQAPVDGIYLVSFGVIWGSGAGVRRAKAVRNFFAPPSVETWQSPFVLEARSPDDLLSDTRRAESAQSYATAPIKLAAGDAVELKLWQNDSGARQAFAAYLGLDWLSAA